MELSEGRRNVPVKFYEDKYGTIIYDSPFTQGTAFSLNDALKIFADKQFKKDMFYYYDDVTDVKVGTFIPALYDKTWKGMKYLGRLEIEVTIGDLFKDSKNSLTYLSKHKNEIPRHNRWMSDMKKVVNEMFEPLKITEDLICSHCGSIIPKGTYFEEYRNKPYHLECIWDKLINKHATNDYEDAKEYFLSLQKHLGNWPSYGLDVEDDYKHDLELVKHNYRLKENFSNLSTLNNNLKSLLENF